MPILPPGALEYISRSPEHSQRVGIKLGQLLQSGDVVCLNGDLGAGKTTFSVGIGKGWGAEQDLTSPTFVIIHQHEREQDRIKLYHVDAYRLPTVEDAASVGLEDIFDADGVVLLEWANRIQSWLPKHHLKITISTNEEQETVRQFIFEPSGKRYVELLDSLKKAIFGV
jgi:tRNA threonylcarbamoyladenosine biosynthesis protein TsaE